MGERPGQDTAGVVSAAAADGRRRPAGTRVVAYPEWEGWAERFRCRRTGLPAPGRGVVRARRHAAGSRADRIARGAGGRGAARAETFWSPGQPAGWGNSRFSWPRHPGAGWPRWSRARTGSNAHQLGAQVVTWSLDDAGLGRFHLVWTRWALMMRQAIRLSAPGAEICALREPAGKPADFAFRDFYRAGAFNARVTAFLSIVPEETEGADLGLLAGLVADGRLRPRVGWTADWTRTADAFAAMARREFRGKAVLTVPPSG